MAEPVRIQEMIDRPTAKQLRTGRRIAQTKQKERTFLAGWRKEEAAKRGLRADGSAALTDFYIPGDFPFGKFKPDVKLASPESLNITFVPPSRDSEERFVRRNLRTGVGHFTKERRAEFERRIQPGGGVYRTHQGVEARKIHQRKQLAKFAPERPTVISQLQELVRRVARAQ